VPSAAASGADGVRRQPPAGSHPRRVAFWIGGAALSLLAVSFGTASYSNRAQTSYLADRLYSGLRDGHDDLATYFCSTEVAEWLISRDKTLGHVVSFRIVRVSSLPWGSPTWVALEVKRSSGIYQERLDASTSLGFDTAWDPSMVSGQLGESKKPSSSAGA
jgi:hypothetical protein